MRGLFDFLNYLRSFFGYTPVRATTPTAGGGGGTAATPAGNSPPAQQTGPPPFPSLNDPKHPFQQMAHKFLLDLTRDVGEAFIHGQDPVTGEEWPERVRDYPWPILVKSGRMRRRALEVISQAKPVTGANSVKVQVDYTDPEYGFFHHFGTRTMPARRFFGYSQQTVDDLTESVTELMGQLYTGTKVSMKQGAN